MKTITEIVTRKKEGIDCTEDESAQIKMFLKEQMAEPLHLYTDLVKDIEENFLCGECTEALDEFPEYMRLRNKDK